MWQVFFFSFQVFAGAPYIWKQIDDKKISTLDRLLPCWKDGTSVLSRTSGFY
jgi:hypothetical protein